MSLTFQHHSPKERPGLGIMKHTKPKIQDSSNKSVSRTIIVSETKQITPLVPTEIKDTEQESKLNKLTELVQMLIDEKILKAKAKPFPPCTHYGFNDHRCDDYRNYAECEICGSYYHSTLGHNHVIHIRGGVLTESSQSNESLIRVKCNTHGSIVHSTSNYNEFDHFKRETHQGAHLVPGQWMLEEYDWCQELSAQIYRATRYPPDEFLYEDDLSRQYQVDYDISYYVIPHGRSLTELTQENHVPEVIVPNEHDVPITEDIEDPPDLINTEGTHEQNV
nr:hypothetical protein [Tanacetum cinerariifolium]